MAVGQRHQVVQRQSLGEATVFVAAGGADQAAEPLPDIGVGAQAVNAGEQRALALAALGVVVQQGAQSALLLGQPLPLRVQCLHLLAQGFLWCFFLARQGLQARGRLLPQRGGAQPFLFQLPRQRTQALALRLRQRRRQEGGFVREGTGGQGLLPGLCRRLRLQALALRELAQVFQAALVLRPRAGQLLADGDGRAPGRGVIVGRGGGASSGRPSSRQRASQSATARPA